MLRLVFRFLYYSLCHRQRSLVYFYTAHAHVNFNFASASFTAATLHNSFLLLSTVQIHNITSLQVLRHLRLPHILLYIHSAGPRLAQVSLHPFTGFTLHGPRGISRLQLWQRVDVKKPFDASCLINATTLKWERQGSERQNAKKQKEMKGHRVW